MVVLKTIVDLCRRQSLEAIEAELLYEAKRELCRAEMIAERALAERDMLRQRVSRMEAIQDGKTS